LNPTEPVFYGDVPPPPQKRYPGSSLSTLDNTLALSQKPYINVRAGTLPETISKGGNRNILVCPLFHPSIIRWHFPSNHIYT
jgi:hypothetical protein